MELLIAGLILFLGSHSVSIFNSSWRDHMVQKIGIKSWQGIYSLLALVGFVLIINGYALARQETILIYQPPIWLRHFSSVLLLPVFPLLIAAYLPGRIMTLTRHPMLVATKLWAVAHLLSNGSLADIILFGSFLAWAVTDRISVKRRVPLPVQELPSMPYSDAIAIMAGLGLYVLFLYKAHAWLIGVSPV